MSEPEEHGEEPRGAGEKLWEATRKTFHTASFQANRYKRMVQKKIDLAALHKKIAIAHSDLGRLIDERREGGGDVLASEEVQELLHKLDSLKQAAATLEEEIEAIKAETPPAEDIPPVEPH